MVNINGADVGKVLKDMYKFIYGKDEPINIFAGGNAGMSIIGMGLMQLAESINNVSHSLDSIATAIAESEDNITVNMADLLPNNIAKKGAEPKEKRDCKDKYTA